MGAQGHNRRFALAVLAGSMLVLSACAGLRSSQTSPSAETSPSASEPSPSPTPTTSSGPLQITSAPFHAGEVGLNYGVVSLGAEGGVPPYTWSIKSGAVPPGLTLASTGALSGKNTKPGKYTFMFQVADSAGTAVAKATSITVYSALKVTQKCVTKCVIGGGCTKCGTFGTVTGGVPPYSYSIASGNVPKGMSWTGLAMKGGFPTGTYSFAVAVGDQLGANATVSANWSVYAPAALNKGGDCIDNHYPPSCTVQWTYSGGNPTVAPKLLIVGYAQACNSSGSYCATPTAPPPGWAVSVKGGVVTLSAQGSGCVTLYVGTVRLALVDTSTCATPLKSNVADLKVDLEYSC